MRLMPVRMMRFAWLLLLCAASCGRPNHERFDASVIDSGSADAGVNDAGVADAGLVCPTLWPIGATSARVTRREPCCYYHSCPLDDGGSVVDTSYDLELVEGRLRWAVCKAGPTLYQGDILLSQAQRARFETAMQGLECMFPNLYFADGAELKIELTVDGGAVLYEQLGERPQRPLTVILPPGVQRVIDTLDDIAGIP